MPDYRNVFFAHNGIGPYPCHFCGEDVTFEKVIVHHEDEDKANNDPVNLEAAHDGCHTTHHKTGWQPTEATRQKLSASKLGTVEKPSSKKSARMKRLYEDPAARRKTGEATSIGRKRQRRSQ